MLPAQGNRIDAATCRRGDRSTTELIARESK